MYNKYNYVSHKHFYLQPSVFSHMVLRPEKKGCIFFNIYVILFVCAAVVAADCFLLSKTIQTQHEFCNCVKMMMMILGIDH